MTAIVIGGDKENGLPPARDLEWNEKQAHNVRLNNQDSALHVGLCFDFTDEVSPS